jgi:poly [ADP-ribose] polymerase
MLKAYNLDSKLKKDASPAFSDNFCVLKTAVLNRADLQANNNKYYVLEVHEAQGRYRLFTHYGRVGTPGAREVRYADNLPEVMAEFERLYREKTGKSKGYVPVEVKQALVGSVSARQRVPGVRSPFPPASPVSPTSRRSKITPPVTSFAPASTLHPDLARFVERIYDATKSELIRRIETPLGSLTGAQIERGQDKLREIRFAIARQRRDRLVALTGEYFSLVPHRIGLRFDPLDVVIDTVKKADDEDELLQLMSDVFHVQDDLEADTDRKYRALGAQMQVLDRTCADFDRIERKIQSSHSWRHALKMNVRRIFVVQSPDERVRFQHEGEPIGNLQELFHGTRNCNLVGILSRGLLIAPRNAPCTGAMFGKGIYFADQSSKSAQYCQLQHADGRPDRGYLFLADVALGRIKREKLACYREQAPDGYDSVQGCRGAYLAHNEYIIYRIPQCTLRYIVEIEAS